MTLSSACAVHCFFSPTFILLTSGLFSFSFDNESVHYLILFLAVPISLYALISGFMNHETAYFLTVGIFGLFVLILAVALGESFLGELGENNWTTNFRPNLGHVLDNLETQLCAALRIFQTC